VEPDLRQSRMLYDALTIAVPDIVPFVRNAVDESTALAMNLYRENPGPATTMIVNQATNDFHDLLLEALELRGRPAVRSARSIIEHAINLRDVVSSGANADRYIAQTAVAGSLEGDAKIGISLLSGVTRKAELFRLKKLRRDSSGPLTEALVRYGPSFRRSWSQSNLFDRASFHGLSDLYSFYRLASYFLHGTAGGRIGTVSDSYPRTVHRTGPNLVMCPPALHEGIRAYLAVVDGMQSTGKHLEADAARQACAALLGLWASYRMQVLQIDKQLWPDSAAENVAVLRLWYTGKRDWFIFLPEYDILLWAVEPQATGTPRDADIENEIAARIADRPPGRTYTVLVTTRISVTPLWSKAVHDLELISQVKEVVAKSASE